MYLAIFTLGVLFGLPFWLMVFAGLVCYFEVEQKWKRRRGYYRISGGLKK